ncbi:MAG: hypothetical protein M1829_001958 [Trizodia sp. TS-e1964]|nr:MAG: hypothetical protein M1829_001958 [Trizodia sp. TS-e1964]
MADVLEGTGIVSPLKFALPAAKFPSLQTVAQNSRDARPNPFLQQSISSLKVEFLRLANDNQTPLKPHVVFQLLLERPYQDLFGCRISMEMSLLDDGLDPLTGHLQCKLQGFSEASLTAILRGQDARCSAANAADLTEFFFVYANLTEHSDVEEKDGCRDFIAQCFVRLHELGVVDWNGVESVKELPGWSHRDCSFHDIIPKIYKIAPPESPPLPATLRLHPGDFEDPRFVRRTIYNSWDLHYLAES